MADSLLLSLKILHVCFWGGELTHLLIFCTLTLPPPTPSLSFFIINKLVAIFAWPCASLIHLYVVKCCNFLLSLVLALCMEDGWKGHCCTIILGKSVMSQVQDQGAPWFSECTPTDPVILSSIKL